jgi:hypothetical protein
LRIAGRAGDLLHERRESLGHPGKHLAERHHRAPRELFRVPEEIVFGLSSYDITADGQRFLMVQKDPFELKPIELAIVPNWTEELKARMAASR